MIANPTMIEHISAPERVGGDEPRQPGRTLNGGDFECLLGLLLSRPAGGEASTEPAMVPLGNQGADGATLTGDTAYPQEPANDAGIHATCQLGMPPGNTEEACADPTTTADLPQGMSLSPAWQLQGTAPQVEMSSFDTSTSLVTQSVSVMADHMRGVGRALDLSGIISSGEFTNGGTECGGHKSTTETASAATIVGSELTGLREAPSAEHDRSQGATVDVKPGLPHLMPRALAGSGNPAEEGSGDSAEFSVKIRPWLDEPWQTAHLPESRLEPIQRAWVRVTRLDTLVSGIALSRRPDDPAAQALDRPVANLTPSTLETFIGNSALEGAPGHLGTPSKPSVMAVDAKAAPSPVAHNLTAISKAESPQSGDDEQSGYEGTQTRQSSETNWIESLLADSAKVGYQAPAAARVRLGQDAGTSEQGLHEMSICAAQGRVTGIAGDGAWSSDPAVGSQHVQGSMISEMIERVMAARASRTSEAHFEIDTGGGETIRVRILLNGRILTGRIGVGDQDTKTVVEGRLWELNQRLESEGFSPQNLGVFILGGGDGQNKKRQYRQPQAHYVLEDRLERGNEPTLVEIEARSFDRWA